ncbi:MAG: hypothetical protein ACKVWV_17255 [Planctomycetota bacterium]
MIAVGLLLGALVCGVLLVPTLLSGQSDALAKRAFNDRYRGTLTIGELDLAWFSPQSIRDAALADPEGKEIGRVSATLPSLWSLLGAAGGRIGAVKVEVEADLVADDQGLTNLERALAPREPTEPTPVEPETESSASPLEFLADLDIDLELVTERLTWSDAETRRIGIPFEVRDFTATVNAKPGQALRAHAEGKLVSESPGKLALDAILHGPVQTGQANGAWPWGKVDVRADVEGFSVAMIDGLLSLDGGLKEMLGARLDVHAKVVGATPEAGDVDIVLNAERSSLSIKGRFADGTLQSRGAPFCVATIAPPQRLIQRFVGSSLPAGMRLVLAPDEDPLAPWTLRIPSCVLPIPRDTSGGLATMRTDLEKLAARVEIELPSGARIEGDALQAAGGALVAQGIQVVLHAAPSAPLRVELDAQLGGAKALGSIALRASANRVWAALADGTMPPLDVQLSAKNLPVAAIEAFAATGVPLDRLLGEELTIDVDARDATAASGTLRASIEARRATLKFEGTLANGVLRGAAEALSLRVQTDANVMRALLAGRLPEGAELAVAPGSVELSVSDLVLPIEPTTADAPLVDRWRKELGLVLELRVPPLAWTDSSLRAAGVMCTLQNLSVRASLAPAGALKAIVRCDLETSSKGKLAIDVETADPFGFASGATGAPMPPVDANVRVDGIPTTLVEALTGMRDLLVPLCGPELAVSLDARNASTTAGSVQLAITGSTLALGFAGKVEGGVLRASGDDGFKLSAKVSAANWQRALGAYLPAGFDVEWPTVEEPLELTVRDIALPLEPLTAANAPKTAIVDGLAAHVVLAIGRVGFANDVLRAAKRDVILRGLTLDTRIAPKTALQVTLSAAIDAAPPGSVKVQATSADPWASLRNAPLAPIDLDVALTGVPTAIVDAFAGGSDMISSLIGERVDFTVATKALTLDGGRFQLRVESPASDVAFAARVQKGVLVAEGDEGLDATITIPKGWLEKHVSPLLPDGTRIGLAEAKPITLRARSLRVPFADASPVVKPASAPIDSMGALADGEPKADPFALIAKIAVALEVVVPALTYADAATGSTPLTIRDIALKVDAAPSQAPAARVTAKLEGAEGGTLDVSVRALDPLAVLAQDGGVSKFRIAADVKAAGVPTALVDALAQQDGLLLDALGARIDATAKSAGISQQSGAFTADLTSPQASAHFAGSIDEGVLTVTQKDPIVARFGLTPLASERVVGKLLPMLVNLQKPQGAEPVLLRFDDLKVPLDFDVRKLDATAHLNLGDVSYRLLPGLESLVGSFADVKATNIPPLTIPIEKGVVRYDALPMKIAGRDVVFKGTFRLFDQEMRLTTELPLAILGKKVSKELDRAREFLDPNMLVPIEISGTWKKPKVSLGKDFVDKVLKEAAKGGLKGLLDGLIDKKKD